MLAVLIHIRAITYENTVNHTYSQEFKQYLHVFDTYSCSINTYSCEYVLNIWSMQPNLT